MSFKSYKEMAIGQDLHLLIILHELCVSSLCKLLIFPTKSGFKAKEILVKALLSE